jgi:hypothetical protein
MQTQQNKMDIQEKLLLSEGDLRKELVRYFYSAREVTVEKPIYETVEEPMLDRETGEPKTDRNGNFLMQKRVEKVDSIKSPDYEPIMSSIKVGKVDDKGNPVICDGGHVLSTDKNGDEVLCKGGEQVMGLVTIHNPMVNLKGLEELTNTILMLCSPYVSTSSFQSNINIEEESKRISFSILMTMIVKRREYGFSLSTVKTVQIFNTLTLLIYTFMSRSRDAVYLDMLSKTTNVNINKTEGGGQQLQRKKNFLSIW